MPKLEFKGAFGRGALSVSPGKGSVIITLKDYNEIITFDLSPDDFGDFTVALWECSPAKKEHDERQMAIFEGAESSQSRSAEAGGAQGRKTSGEEAAEDGDGPSKGAYTGV